MGCAGCGRTRGLAGAYAVDGAKFLDCLVQHLGFPAGTTWNAEVHAKLYDDAASVINLRGDLTLEQFRAVPFLSQPHRTAEIAANLPTSKFTDEADPFWTCLGITRSRAVSAVTSSSGGYWNMLIAAGAIVSKAEGARSALPRRGSIVAAGVTLVLGAAALEIMRRLMGGR